MPKNLTGDATSFPTQTAPLAGEPRTAGSVETPFKNSADRTAWLKDHIEYLDPGRAGVRRLRRFSSIATLAASTDHPDKTVAQVDGVGIYQYDAAATAPAASPFVVTPTDVGVGAGRWLWSAYGALNIANGVPQLDASAKLPTSRLAAGDVSERVLAGVVRWGLASYQHVYVAASVDSASPMPVDVTDVLVDVDAVAGDLLEVCLTTDLSVANVGEVSAMQLVVVNPDTSSVVIPGSSYRASSATAVNAKSMTVVQAITQNGVHRVKMQHAGLDGGTARTSKSHLIARLYRP